MSALSNPELEAAIAANPDDVAAYVVYGDWLQSKGDPLGELIAVQAARAKSPNDVTLAAKESELLAAHRGEWLGALPEAVDNELSVVWKYGFLESVSIGGDEGGEADAVRAFDALADLRVARFLRDLEFGVFGASDGNPDYGPLLRRIAERGVPPTLRRFEIDIGGWQTSWSELGDLSVACRALAKVERIRLYIGHMVLGELDFPNLRAFRVETGSFTRENAASVARAKWPKLEELVLYFGDPNYGGDCSVDDIAPILAGEGLSRVRHLGLANAMFANDIAREITRSKILPQLAELDLSNGAMTEEGAELLLEHQDALMHLERLDLSSNLISEDACDELGEAFGARVALDDQEDDDPDYRYVRISE